MKKEWSCFFLIRDCKISHYLVGSKNLIDKKWIYYELNIWSSWAKFVYKNLKLFTEKTFQDKLLGS